MKKSSSVLMFLHSVWCCLPQTERNNLSQGSDCVTYTAQKTAFPIKYFCKKLKQFCKKLRKILEINTRVFEYLSPDLETCIST